MGWMVIGWLLAGVIGIILSWAFGDSLIGGSIGWVISGAIGGLLTGYALTLLRTGIQGKLIIRLALGWAIILAFFEAIARVLANNLEATVGWTLSWAIIGVMGGLLTGYALIQVEPRIQKQKIALLILAIAIGWTIGGVLARTVGEAFSWVIGWAIVGATQGSIILWCLNPPRKLDIRT